MPDKKIPPTPQPLSERLLFLFCRPRYVNVIMQEMDDWCKQDGGRILRYGYSDKAKDGFVLMSWHDPIPDALIEKLMRESDIFDVVLIAKLPESEPATT